MPDAAGPEPSIFLVGLNHRTSPLEARERWSFPSDRAVAAMEALRSCGGAVILSTCNRTEICGLGDARATLDALGEFAGVPVAPDEPYFYRYRGEGAVQHLFRVAAGLDSQILGEAQIQGQIRAALELAQRAGALPQELRMLWEQALRVGKRARTETAIGEGTITAGQAAVQLASKVYHRPAEHPVLLIGSGKVGRLAARAFRDLGARAFRVTSRTEENARALAEAFGADERKYEALDDAIVEADIVISCTAAPAAIVDPERMRDILHRRGQRPLVVIDLAVPRDFAPEVARLPSIFLCNIDDLTELVKESLREREGEIPKVERIVGEEVEKFRSLLRYRTDVEPLLGRLYRESESIQREALEPLRDVLDAETFRRVEGIVRAVSGKILYLQTERLKTLRDGGGLGPEEARLLRRLFLEEAERGDPAGDAR